MLDAIKRGKFPIGNLKKGRIVGRGLPIIPHRDYEKILKLRSNGATYREIGERYAVSPQAVQQYLKNRALALEPKSEGR